MFVHHGGAMKMTFHDQLVTTRDRKHSKDHLFFQLWAQGKLTKKQTVIYCAQHYHYVTEYLNWMAYEGADEIHGARGFEIVEKYCNAPELQASALKAVEAATIRRWRYMNGIYWFAVHGKEDDTPIL